ncbi:MAG: GNAT family N-acetyltransferase [Chloroflexota bacterium]
MTINKSLSNAVAVQAIEQNLDKFVGLSQHWPACDTRVDQDIVWAISDTPFYTLNNVAQARLNDAQAAETIEQVAQLSSSKQVPVIWWVGPLSTPESLGAQLEAHGFMSVSQTPGMALDLTRLAALESMPARLNITKVSNQDDLNRLNQVSARGIDLGPETEAATLEMLSSAMVAATGLQYYIGWFDNKPVATASMLLDDRVAGIYNVVTLPEVRKRGIGSAMTHFALKDALTQGAQIGILHSSPLGINVYRGLGFEVFCQFQLYLCGAEYIRQ